MNEALMLEASLFCNMAIGRQVQGTEAPFVGLEFSDEGSLLAAYTVDTLYIYDMMTAKKTKTLRCVASKIAFLRYTHSPTAVVMVPDSDPQNLHVWSIYENEIVKTFKGPTNSRVTSLSMCPTSDRVMTTDRLGVVRVYDLNENTQDPILVMNYPFKIDSLVCTWDHMGEGFFLTYTQTTGTSKFSTLAYFELKEGEVRLLNTLRLTSQGQVVSIKADFHGKTLAVLNDKNVIMLVPATLKKVLYEIRHPELAGTVFPEFSYSPDSKFLLTGEEDGTVKIFDVEKGVEIARYPNHPKPCLCVKFSPAHVLFASACHNLIFWIPKYWERT